MTELGARLRAARLAKGFAIADLAARTHIRTQYLLALEDGRFSDLPGRAYGAGFVKSVARELGLDPASAADQFAYEAVAVEPGHPHPMFLNFEKAGQPKLQFLVVAAMMVLAALAIWKTVTPSEAGAPGMVEDVPEKIRQAAETPAQSPSAAQTTARNWQIQPQTVPAPNVPPAQLAHLILRQTISQ